MPGPAIIGCPCFIGPGIATPSSEFLGDFMPTEPIKIALGVLRAINDRREREISRSSPGESPHRNFWVPLLCFLEDPCKVRANTASRRVSVGFVAPPLPTRSARLGRFKYGSNAAHKPNNAIAMYSANTAPNRSSGIITSQDAESI